MACACGWIIAKNRDVTCSVISLYSTSIWHTIAEIRVEGMLISGKHPGLSCLINIPYTNGNPFLFWDLGSLVQLQTSVYKYQSETNILSHFRVFLVNVVCQDLQGNRDQRYACFLYDVYGLLHFSMHSAGYVCKQLWPVHSLKCTVCSSFTVSNIFKICLFLDYVKCIFKIYYWAYTVGLAVLILTYLPLFAKLYHSVRTEVVNMH